jgi:hypothetical protein
VPSYYPNRGNLANDKGWLNKNLPDGYLFPNHSTWLKTTLSNNYMIKSIQLAIIQAFTAPWEIQFEQMVVILDFHQKMNNNDNIISSVYQIHL